MKSFFDSGTVVGHDTLTVHRTPKVIEIEFPGSKGSLFTYLLPHDDKTAWVVACWADTLDFLDQTDLREVTANWPVAARLLKNARERKFEEGGLVRIKDPETGERRWGVMTEVSGMDIQKNADNLWGFPQLLKAIEVVHLASAKMYEELKNHQPENWPEAQKKLLDRCEGAEESLFFDFGFLQ